MLRQYLLNWSLHRREIMSGGNDIGSALDSVLQKISSSVLKRSQDLPKIPPRLVAVTKTKPVHSVIEAYNAGQRHFGENYVQEFSEKAYNSELLEKCTDIRWHFIGHLQRNSINKLLDIPNLYMIETVHKEKLATAMNNYWERMQKSDKLNVMIQINTSGEESKHGCQPAESLHLFKFIKEACPKLNLIGLMTIGAFGYDLSSGPNPDFQALLKCREGICKAENIKAEEIELSMGMSGDYEHAIEVGSTNVRVGSTIFGARDYNKGAVNHAVQDVTTSTENLKLVKS